MEIGHLHLCESLKVLELVEANNLKVHLGDKHWVGGEAFVLTEIHDEFLSQVWFSLVVFGTLWSLLSCLGSC